MSSNTENRPSRSISIGLLMRVDIGNVNSGWTEGVVTAIKKVERPDGYFHPYISGQALRRYIRDTMKDIILDNESYKTFKISPEETGQDRKSPIITKGDPRNYFDDDLFGFMMAIKNTSQRKDNTEKSKDQKKSKSKHLLTTNEQTIKNQNQQSLVKIPAELDNVDTTQINNVGKDEGGESTRKRTSPLRVSPAFGLFRLNSDRDLGTRSAMEVKGSADAGGSIFETEITSNIFRSSLLLELDRVGVWKRYETTDRNDWKNDPKRRISLELSERKQRIKLLLESLKYLWGGGRQSRFLVDLVPTFIIYARTTQKFPLFLNCLNVHYNNSNSDINYRINTELLQETINDYSDVIQNIIVGIRKDMFTNSESDFTKMFNNVSVFPPGKAITLMTTDIDKASIAETKIASNQTRG